MGGEVPSATARRPGATRWERGLALSMALCASAVAAFLSIALFDGLPRVGDEVSYALQGRILASGRLFLPPPEAPEAFTVDNVILEDALWCSKYPPGFPLLLAPGWLLGTPWLVNPILFGLAVYGVFRLGSQLFRPSTGLIGAALFATLPFALLQAASFMPHVATAALALWALSWVADGDSPGFEARLAGSGTLAGLAFLVRPVSAILLLAVPCLLLVGDRFPPGKRFRALLRFGPGLVLPIAFLLFVQWSTFGSPFRTGYEVFDPSLGFSGDRWGHRAFEEIFGENVRRYSQSLPAALWAVPGLPGLWLLLLLLKPGKGTLLAAVPAVGLILGHCFYFFNDVLLGGPRFLFEATPFLALLLAAGLGNVVDLLEPRFRAWHPRAAPLPVVLGVLGAGLVAAATVTRELPAMQAHSKSFMVVPNDPMKGAETAGVGRSALVLVGLEDPRGLLPYTAANAPVYYGYLFGNALEPADGARVFVRDLPGRRLELERAFPRDETWRVTVLISAPFLHESPIIGPTVLHGIRWQRIEPGPGSAESPWRAQ